MVYIFASIVTAVTVTFSFHQLKRSKSKYRWAIKTSSFFLILTIINCPLQRCAVSSYITFLNKDVSRFIVYYYCETRAAGGIYRCLYTYASNRVVHHVTVLSFHGNRASDQPPKVVAYHARVRYFNGQQLKAELTKLHRRN